ncbi:unnamed protein product [Sphagnum compactum]
MATMAGRSGSSISRDGEKSSEEEELEEEQSSKPWFVVPLLVCAVLAVSSAGAVTKLMVGAAPVANAGWRLQVTSLILLPGFIWQWLSLPIPDRQKVLLSVNLTIIGFSGIALALHFGLWVWSLEHTSLSHSLLFVSTPPIIVAAVACGIGQPLSKEEILGVVVGMGGVVIVAAGSRTEHDSEVTLLGDLASFAAAAAFVVYISAGRYLRVWMPLYVYAFPVTAVAALLLSLAGQVLGGSSGQISAPLGWLRTDYLLPVLFLAVGPGFVGHTGLNAVLKYSSSLIVAMAVTLEPPIGIVIGWILHVTPLPGIWTCIGGFVLLLGTMWLNYVSDQQQKVSKENLPLDDGGVHRPLNSDCSV